MNYITRWPNGDECATKVDASDYSATNTEVEGGNAKCPYVEEGTTGELDLT